MLLKTKSQKLLLFLLIFSFLFIPVSRVFDIKPQAAANENDLQKQITDKKASLNATADKRKSLEAKISALKSEKSDAERDKRNYDDLISMLESEIKDTEELVELIKEAIEQDKEDIRLLQEKYDKSYAVFLEIIKFAYEKGDINYLDLLLDSENFTDFLNRVDIISNIFEYNKNVISNLQKDKENLIEKVKYQELMLSQQDEYIKEREEKLTQVSGWLKDAVATIKKIQDDIAESEAKQAQFDLESKNIEAEILRASKELVALQESKRKYVGGNFIYPVTPKYSYVVSSGFGWRTSPITGRSEFHNGIDIPAQYGSDIWTVNDGTVIIATYGTGYGNYIVIDHGGGKTTLYAHCSSLIAKVGANVTKGEVIAKVGSTGWSTGNHLHFSYAEDGVFKNPMPLLNQ